MRIKKRVLWWLISAAILFGNILYVLEFRVNTDIEHYMLYWNLLLSGFSSSCLLLVVTSIEYKILKRKTLENFYLSTNYLINKYFELEPYLDFDENICKEMLSKKMIILCELSEFDLDYYGKLFADIDLFCDYNMQTFIYQNIYSEIVNKQNELKEICYHYKNYFESPNERLEHMMRNYFFPKMNPMFFKSVSIVRDGMYCTSVYHVFGDKLFNDNERLRSYIYGNEYVNYESQPISVTAIKLNT